jgi:(p)ppGpp synthase/HD superfamily hydrolase
MWSIDRLQELWQVATELHEGQTYGSAQKGRRTEYLNHIGSVTFEILAAIAESPDLDADLALACAVLHDTVEDTPYTYEAVQARFGTAVADGVLALTKNEDLGNKELQMNDSLMRILEQPKAVWAVKMADRICNLQQPPYYWNNEKRKAYQQEAQLIYTRLKAGNTYLAERLKTKIGAYEQYFTLHY